MSSDGLHIYLALVRADLLRVGRKVGFSSHKVTPTFWRVWHPPVIRVLIFTRCVVQHLRLSNNYRGLRSLLEFPTSTSVCLMFSREGSEDVHKLVYNFRAIWSWGSVQIISVFLSLVAGSSTPFNLDSLEAV